MGHHGRYGLNPVRAGGVFGQAGLAGAAPRLLVVDDHALVRHGLALAIRVRFPAATVFEAGSLAEAVRRVQSVGNLSAVLFDLQLGDSNGLPGVQTMLRILDGVPLLVISGSPDASLITACIQAGARGFLPKGAEAEVLDHALPIVLGGGIYAPLPRPGAGPAQAAAPVAQTPPLVPGAMEGLTERQRDVLKLLLDGQSNKEIARSLGVLEGTVKVHLRSIMQRLGVRNRTQLALLAAKSGLTM
ncbi:response regulator transcription factor [Azospirillum soli]|uniref:response regulator transcription factor n=1 Tax=Azospirillum soli TaxID=1304799 RepID=UPI001AE4EC6A|nr:response regulator transcription factor [Azospirillum soli]MBP2313754.1 DNA-binding NarL/FixJ family response regulator [Azospirillum soli]